MIKNKISYITIILFGSNHYRRIGLYREGKINLRSNAFNKYKKSLRVESFNIGFLMRTALVIINSLPINILMRIIKALTQNKRPKIKNAYYISYNAERVNQNKQQTIVYMGDSHSEFWSRIWSRKCMPDVLALHCGPILANSLADKNAVHNEAISFFKYLFDNQSMKSLCVVFSLGEIDIRAHSYSQVRILNNYFDIEEYTKHLALKYVNGISTFQSKLKRAVSYLENAEINVVVRRQIPPSKNQKTYIPSSKDDLLRILKSESHPCIGPVSFRVKVDQLLWNYVKQKANMRSIPVQDLYRALYTKEGTLKASLSKDACHLYNQEYIYALHYDLLDMINN